MKIEAPGRYRLWSGEVAEITECREYPVIYLGETVRRTFWFGTVKGEGESWDENGYRVHPGDEPSRRDIRCHARMAKRPKRISICRYAEVIDGVSVEYERFGRSFRLHLKKGSLHKTFRTLREAMECARHSAAPRIFEQPE